MRDIGSNEMRKFSRLSSSEENFLFTTENPEQSGFCVDGRLKAIEQQPFLLLRYRLNQSDVLTHCGYFEVMVEERRKKPGDNKINRWINSISHGIFASKVIDVTLDLFKKAKTSNRTMCHGAE